MSLWQPEAVGLGVTAQQWAVAWRLPGQRTLDWKASAFDAADDLHTSAALAAVPAGPLRITLDDGLVRQWVMEAPEGTGSLRELRSYAALRFESLFGELASEWEIEGDWRASGPMVCHALPRALVRRLQDWAGAARRPIADRLACASRLHGLVQKTAALRSAKCSVWVSVGAGHCTLRWASKNLTTRLSVLRTDSQDPWMRVVQEIQRVGVLATGETDSIQPVHWASLLPCAEPEHPTLSFVRHRPANLGELTPASPEDPVAAVLARWGCA